MTKEQAETSIKFLESIWSDCEFDRGALRYSVEALERQIPMKPLIEHIKIYHEFGDAEEIEEKDYYHCPNCNNKVIKAVKRNDFCNLCSQAIDWSEVG